MRRVEQLPSTSHSFRIVEADTGRQIALISHHPGQRPKEAAIRQEYADAILLAAARELLRATKYLIADCIKATGAETATVQAALQLIGRIEAATQYDSH